MGRLEKKIKDSMIGKRVGVYELKKEIGRGGMGAVYLAERADGEFRQTVAVKLIKRGMDTDLVLEKFRRERQIFASLDHPNIAYFLSGGSTDDGLPYFVMEYIKGKPLYKFCDENRLGINERLQIFRKVCDAVEAAHQKKIIHRDLKPSNILVKADGTPKLLDFGIAKVFDADADVDPDPTTMANRIMTPEYASPEQIAGEFYSSAADVYSLGIILYELVSGHRPYKLNRQTPHEISRIIREEIPLPPSKILMNETNRVLVFGKEKTTIETVFEVRNSTPQDLQKTISGDLDKIILKTLRKNPAERYDSAAVLSQDVENFLENRPVNAKSFSMENKLKNPVDKISAAILPLKIIGAGDSKNTDDIFLGIGLADALVSRLSGVRRLIVRPTSSVLPFAGENPVEAGKKIGVDYILDGSIQRTDERIRVTVHLINVAENSTVWAEKFDEKFTDVLELEDLISEKVAKVLLPQLTGEERQRLEKRGTNNAEAYRFYLRGRYSANQFTDEALVRSVESYKEAIRLDPHYALPHIGIANFYIWSSVFGKIPSPEAYPKAKKRIQNALEIDDSLGEAYAILAFITLLYDWNWPEAKRLIQIALELNPNFYFAHECYSNFFSSQGIYDKAIEEIRHAEELDPLSPRAKLMTAWTLYQAGDFTSSVAKAGQANEMQPDFPQGFLHLGNALAHTGKNREAIAALNESLNLDRNSEMAKFMLCYSLAAEGQTDKARKIIIEMKNTAENHYVKPYFMAMAYASVGDIDESFRWFEKSLEDRDEWMIWFGSEPKLKNLRTDRRYFETLKRTNNPIIETQFNIKTVELTTRSVQKSIAVLPFKLLGGEKTDENAFLSIGLADALTMRLSNVRRFLVRPTSSVLRFSKSDINPFEAGHKLAVDFIVDGNIRQFGERLRITAQLLNIGEDSTVWAERFDENYTDILTLEDSISKKVTKSLLPKLSDEEQHKFVRSETDNPRAFEAYMRGRYFWNQFSPEVFPKALSAFEEAVALDENYALAYVGIADFYNWASIYGIFSSLEIALKVKNAAVRALEIDPTSGEAHASLGLYYSSILEYEKAEENYRRAVELSPNYQHGYEWLAGVLVGTGRFDEGVRIMRIAEKLDPLSLRTKTQMCWIAYQARYFEEVESKAREIIALEPTFFHGFMQLCNVLPELGKISEAVEMGSKALEIMPKNPLPIYSYCFALVADGQIEKARQCVFELEEMAKSVYVIPYFLGAANLSIGNIDRAFEHFEAALRDQTHWLLWFGTDCKFDPIRRDERYIKLFRQMNNPLAEKQTAKLSASIS